MSSACLQRLQDFRNRDEWTQKRVQPSESENPADRPVCVFSTGAERSVTVKGET